MRGRLFHALVEFCRRGTDSTRRRRAGVSAFASASLRALRERLRARWILPDAELPTYPHKVSIS